MKVLSLKLKEDIFKEVESVVKEIHMPRNAYINKALLFFNKLNKRKLLRKKLEQESHSVQSISLKILGEMEKVEDNFDL